MLPISKMLLKTSSRDKLNDLTCGLFGRKYLKEIKVFSALIVLTECQDSNAYSPILTKIKKEVLKTEMSNRD